VTAGQRDMRERRVWVLPAAVGALSTPGRERRFGHGGPDSPLRWQRLQACDGDKETERNRTSAMLPCDG
jgi:hypothetical protein